MVRAIVYQQLAGRAAKAIHGRLEAAVRGDVTPDTLARLDDETYATCGLSAAKREAVRDLAAKVRNGTVRPERHGRMTDSEVVEELITVRGIGPWTAQMYLMSQLGRHDVWPVLDFGVRSGWSQLHGLTTLISSKELAGAANHLAPYRSSVAWYCWQAVDLGITSSRSR